MNRVMEVLEDVVDTLVEVGYGTTDEMLHEAADKLIAIRDGKLGSFRPENVPVTVDIVIRLLDHERKIVLIERKNFPHGWAIPGGFVEGNESVAQAAVREAKEETGLDVTLTGIFGVYSKPGRDPRGPVVSIAFTGWARGTPKAADDAKNVRMVHLCDALTDYDLAFDHHDVLIDFDNYYDASIQAPFTR